MATYGTDLTDITDAESGDTWVEMTSPWDVGDAPAEGENDYYIQGASCASTDTNNKTGLASGCVNNGSSLAGSFTDGVTVVLIWHVFLPGNGMESFANGGYRAIVGSSTTVFGAWKVGGRDFGRNPFGGWHCYAVDPSKTPDYTVGSWTPGAAGSGYQYFGAATNLTAEVNKGTMHAWDAIRYGRGEIYCTGAGCTFTGMAQYNDYNDAVNGYNSFGLFQSQGGIYLWKGLMSIGQSGTAATFSDANKTIIVDNTPAVYSTFNRIAIRHADTSVSWDNVTIKATGTTSRGEFEVVEDATVEFDGCSFQDMSTFTFLSNSTIASCIFKTCGQISAGGGHFLGCSVLTSNVAANASAFVWDTAADPDGYLDNMTFSMGSNNHHAIEFGTNTPEDITLRGWTVSGFSGSNEQDGSVLYIAQTTGTVTINLVGCTGTFTYKSAGANINIVINPVTTKVEVKSLSTDLPIENARVLLLVADGINFPYQDAVDIVRVNDSGVVTHVDHGLSTNAKVYISGANEPPYNGVKSITYVDTDTYYYIVSGEPDTPATGDILATLALISDLTSASGIVTDLRTFPNADQPVAGVVRKSSATPIYKDGRISGTVDKDAGTTFTILLASDE